MSVAPIVLISRDSPLTKTIRKVIDRISGCRLSVFARSDDALSRLERAEATLVIYHLQDGVDETDVEMLLSENSAEKRSTAILVLTDTYWPEQTLKLLRMGVSDCLCRPLDLRRLAYLVDSLTLRARHQSSLEPAPIARAEELSLPRGQDPFYCGSPEMVALIKRIRMVADLDSIILFTGETGTGKTRSAQLIHEFSSRRRNPFLVVDCGALAESLIESELFGHCKGAFTGADTDRMGKFAAAANGTLFLDDVDTLPLSVQCKLLRVVENRVFEAVGSDKPLKLKARLLVASNRNLEDEVVAGRFRSDLYYRLNVIECRLPPLRKRKPAIRPIAERFLIEIADRNGRSVPQISGEALQTLETYDWPGNLRELRNVIEQASVLRSGDKIRLEDLSEHLLSSRSRQVSATTTAFSSSHAVDADRPRAEEISDAASVLSDDSQTVPGPTDSEILVMAPKKLAPLPLARAYGEIKRIKQALIETCNNRSQAARELGISRVALYKKLHKYGLINFGQKLVGSGVNCGASGE